ncbi:MAG: hypothetical protein WEC75_06365 [Dehalococcoidia bacterium]
MSEAPVTDPPVRAGRFGCLARASVALVVIVGLLILLGELLDQGKDPSRTGGCIAGPAAAYLAGDVSESNCAHIFIARLDDGSFVALYDLSPKQQELDSGCRVLYDETATLSALAQLEGFRGGFVEDCEDLRTVWRADGLRDAGAGYGNLDRFETSVDAAGDVIIDTASRSCTKSRGVPGLPPYEVRRCGAP